MHKSLHFVSLERLFMEAEGIPEDGGLNFFG